MKNTFNCTLGIIGFGNGEQVILTLHDWLSATFSAIVLAVRGPRLGDSFTVSRRNFQLLGNSGPDLPFLQYDKESTPPNSFKLLLSTCSLGTPRLTARPCHNGTSARTPSKPASDGIHSDMGVNTKVNSTKYYKRVLHKLWYLNIDA